MGKLHIALVADSSYTRLLRDTITSLLVRSDTPMAQVKRDLLAMPQHCNCMQARAQLWLSEASEGELPHFTLDKCALRVVPEFKDSTTDSVTTRVITLFNHSDYAIDVQLQMPGQGAQICFLCREKKYIFFFVTPFSLLLISLSSLLLFSFHLHREIPDISCVDGCGALSLHSGSAVEASHSFHHHLQVSTSGRAFCSLPL
jgi:hypothetical protein